MTVNPADISYLDSRQQFERNFYILAELLRSKKMVFHAEAANAPKSLLKIQNAPNGRINLLTIDEVARATANGIKQMIVKI